MVALIVEKTSSGRTRVCCSRCYNAKGTECVCCCGGLNHGMGYDKAVSNTRQVVQEVLNKPNTTTFIKLPFKGGAGKGEEIMEKIFIGKRLELGRKTASSVKVFVTQAGKSRELSPAPSQEVYNHSPDGFNWGYGGSGPAQLALAILLEVTGNERVSLAHYQDFKQMFVAGWDDEWGIDEEAIKYWLGGQE